MKCLWCLKTEMDVNFSKGAHTIPKSLGGQNKNKNVCNKCNEYFGFRQQGTTCSIETVLKEGFNISRWRLISSGKSNRKVGEFKSIFFDLRIRNGKKTLKTKDSLRMSESLKIDLGRSFKRGLYKMYFEELNRQNRIGYESKYNHIRDFARYNKGNLTIIYYKRSFGAIMSYNTEGYTPELIFERMEYLELNDKFVEIEFLGHVFGLAVGNYSDNEFKDYIDSSMKKKNGLFKGFHYLNKLTEMDVLMSFMNN